jgi:thiamine pyrophosphate-dependent acetolactate synthase large subunit-like protein
MGRNDPCRAASTSVVDAMDDTGQLDFPATGAAVFARLCKTEAVGALFCCPGNYDIIHAVAAAGIRTYGGRTEGAMAHAADAFVRVSGQIAMCSAHQGPGLTNMICGIAAASAARTPMLVVASHMPSAVEDTESGINSIYQQPLTDGLKKYGKRITVASRIHEYAAYAFRQLKSGVPRPVHLDVPQDVACALFQSPAELDFYERPSRYRTDARPHPSPKQIAAAIDLLKQAARPILVSSNGVFYSAAWDPLRRLAEKASIPVVESGAMKGQFSDAHPLSANAAPEALARADVVVLIGQHCMPTVGEFAFARDAKYIRVDQAHEDIGRNVPIDVGIVSCERAALEELADLAPPMRHDAWVAEIADARRRFETVNEEYYQHGLRRADCVHPAVIGRQLAAFLYESGLPRDRVTVVSGGYGVARYTRRWLRAFRPAQVMNAAYHYAAIGPDVGFAVGAAAAVSDGAGAQAAHRGAPIVCITGDAGFAYTGMEIETLVRCRLPAIVIVYNNAASGTWRNAPAHPAARALHVFQEDLRYDRIAEALGAHGEHVTSAGDFTPALRRAFDIASAESRPAVLNCIGRKELWTEPPGFLDKTEPGCMSYHH